jgi:type IV pilus assembly protein PilN
MIRINLLPFRSTRKKENIRRQLSIFLLSLILSLVALFGVNLLLSNQIDDLNSRMTTAQAELQQYEKINKDIEEIKKKLDTLNKKMAVIRELDTNRYEPVRLMDTLSQVIVEKRMWISKISTKSDSISLDGMAMDDKTVADFMTRLESCGLFSSVHLKTLKQVDKSRLHKTFEENRAIVSELTSLRIKTELTVAEKERLKELESIVLILKSFEITCNKKPLQTAETSGPAQAGAKKE